MRKSRSISRLSRGESAVPPIPKPSQCGLSAAGRPHFEFQEGSIYWIVPDFVLLDSLQELFVVVFVQVYDK